MKAHVPLTIATSLLVTLALLTSRSAQGQVLTLDFSEGNGTTLVDQYTGTAGSGWSTAWGATFHSGVSNGVATVDSSSPLTPGGGNYLHMTYDTNGAGTTYLARLARQWDTSAVSLASPIAIAFDIRSDVNVLGTSQNIVLFGSNVSASGTSSADSWKLSADGAGWGAFDGTTHVAFGSGSVLADQTWRIILTIDPVANTYDASVQNLTTSSAVFSLSDLDLRNGADASLSFLNFHATAPASLTGRGFSIDNLSVVPEPGSASLALLGLAAIGLYHKRNRTQTRA